MFFFNATATTETYTHCHTLSLHYALPIYHLIGMTDHRGAQHFIERADMRQARWTIAGFEKHIAFVGCALAMAFQQPARLFKRSEEHTSELQSLMRISYAAFCLKKKTASTPQI